MSSFVLDLAAPWGGFSLPGQLMARAGPKQALHAAVQSATMHAHSEPEPAAAVPGRATTSSSNLELRAADASPAQQSDSASAVPQTAPEPAASLAAESADSWDTGFTEAPQKLPDAAQSGDEPSQVALASAAASPDEHAASPPAVPSAAALPDALGNRLLQPSPPASADAVSTGAQRLQGSSEQLEVPRASAAIAQTQVGHRTPPGSIDWSSLDFDFGPEEDFHAAVSETSPGHPDDPPQHASADAEQQSKSAAPDRLHEGAPQNRLYLESHRAEPQGCLDAEPAAAAAEEEVDWDFGEFAEAKEPAQGPVIEATAFRAAAMTPPQLEVEAAPSLATGLPSPRLSAQLAPAGSYASAVLSFDQWGRAYSQLERQAARSGSAKQPLSSARDAEDTAVSFSESSWQAPESSPVDLWASLAALNEAHTLGAVSERAQQQVPGQGAFTDPFAAFESQPEAVSFQHGADVVNFSTEAELISLPMPAVDGHAPSGHAKAGLQGQEVSFQAEQAAEDPQETKHPEMPTKQRGEASYRVPEPAGSFAPQRSWGDGWADSVAEVVPDQAAWPAAESAGSWRRMQQDDLALQKALGCDRQTALLCLAQVCTCCLSTTYVPCAKSPKIHSNAILEQKSIPHDLRGAQGERWHQGLERKWHVGGHGHLDQRAAPLGRGLLAGQPRRRAGRHRHAAVHRSAGPRALRGMRGARCAVLRRHFSAQHGG